MRVRNGPWIALSALLVLAAAYLLYETRDTTFWFDEWSWVIDRRGSDLATFLDPHNSHLSLVPVAIYKTLFATAGLDDYAPYRVVIIALHLACVALVFAYTRRRVGDLAGGLAALVILLLGPAWQNIIWPFQMGSVTSLAAGVGALLALDRRDRRGDVAACVLVGLSLASSGTGVVVAIGAAVEVLVNRRRPRDLWIVALPAVPYALWWLIYQDTDFTRHNLVLAPGFAADMVAGSVSALSGLSGATTSDTGATLPWGRPLAVAGAALLAWRLATMGPIPRRAVTLLVLLAAFTLLTAVQRADEASADSSRYLYTGAVIIVLLTAELARGVAFAPRALAVLAAVVGLAIVANVGDLRDAARMLRDQAAAARADLGALELARPTVPGDYLLTSFPGYPYVGIRAGAYFDAARQYGSPADSPAQLGAAPEPARQAADAELARMEGATLTGASHARSGTADPAVEAAAGGRTSTRDGCVTFRPDTVRLAGTTPELVLTLPPGGLVLTTADGPATISLRRFAAGFPATELGRIAASSSAALRVASDGDRPPWHVRVAPEAAVTACGAA